MKKKLTPKFNHKAKDIHKAIGMSKGDLEALSETTTSMFKMIVDNLIVGSDCHDDDECKECDKKENCNVKKIN